MKKILFLLAIVIWTAKASAIEELYVNCENCTNTLNAAANAQGATDDLYKVHVFDFYRETITTYRIAQIDGGGYTIRKRSTSSSIKQGFDAVINSINQLKEEVSRHTVPSFVIDSAWSLYGSREHQNIFMDYVTNDPSVTLQLVSDMNSWTGIVRSFFGVDISIPIYVRLQGGGTIAVEFNYVKLFSDGSIEYEFKINFARSTDSKGQPLVLAYTDGGEEGNGIYQFERGTADHSAFAQVIRVNTTFSGSSGTSCTMTIKGTKVTITCSRP